ncbi:MAG: lamin tail domain-containing protein [Anaerolineaceae bacterium]|jgi:hypothetical protein|nr:lamin tail domain-containing protein [Anaerolineaceae bacterium]MDD4042979.1 lamin tail domain-containing protein [Anaerolineaceae bacterium]MDD4577516.1 lamin tail domain-containing protein [Anaerolineaceae bacterium]
MTFWKKTFPFLLLNIVVSAATMLLVLWLWQRGTPILTAKPTLTPAITLASAPSQANQEVSAETDAPLSDGLLSIEGVFGAGDLNVEYILIRNQSDSSVNLNGWSLSSSSGETYSLPQLTLNKNGAVRLYSKHGTNSVIELYWNSDQALWTSGSQIKLLDQSGQQHASWLVP